MLQTEFHPALEKESRRLLVMLHGLGDSAAGYRWLPEMLQLPGLNYLLVNAPDPYFGGFSWYDFAGDAAPGILRSRRQLFELLDDFRAKGYPSIQTILGGFSQGCLMTWEAGFYYPHRFAGLVGISGYAAEPEQEALSPEARHQQFLITHGTLDPLVPFAEVKKQVQSLQRLGLRIQWHEFKKAHTIAGHEEIDLIRNFIKRQLKD